jgi:two-component system sensor histidine kinase PilS (NtrC family)
MNIIVRECDRLDNTIEAFLQFSRPSSPERRWFSLHALAEECIQLLHHKSDWDQTCNVHIAIPLKLEAYGEPDQIKQVLINLISNACTAMEGMEGRIELAAEEKKSANGHESTVLTVFNSGPAIADGLLETIFEPFFTTRDSGTGLGLAIVRQIVERHGGTIKAENLSADKGVVFTVTLPLP